MAQLLPVGMATPFARTTRSLALDGHRRSIAALVVALGALGGWAAWAFGARVTVHETSRTARLETTTPPHRVRAPLDGVVAEVFVELGDAVDRGAPLVRLRSETQERELMAAEAERDALRAELEPLEAELAAVRARIEQDPISERSTVSEAEADHRAAEAAARLTRERSERLAVLAASGAAPETDRAEAEVEALRDASAAEAASIEIARVRWEHRLRSAESRARIEAVRRDIERTRGALAAAGAGIERLRAEIARRTVLAPGDGRVASIEPLSAGSYVGAGESLLTIVPRRELRVVAYFSPEHAFGRLRAGQTAKVRLDAFPWTQYGTLGARVARVGDEIEREGVRVELALVDPARFAAPLAHGQPGSVEVAVEHTAPALLLVRAATPWLDPARSP